MKFETTAAEFRDVLATARQALATTPSLVAYSGIHLSLEGEILSATGSDGETTISATLRVSDAVKGSVLLLAKPLATYLGTHDGSTRLTVEATEHGDELLVALKGQAPYRFRTLASSYPTPPFPQGDTKEVDFTGLSAGLAAVRTAVSRENSAVQVVSDENDLVLHSTDNYRLVRAVVTGGGFGSFTGVVSLSLLERVAKLGARTVTIDSRSRLLAFSAPHAKVVSRLLSVPFPAVESVVANRPSTSVTLPTREVTAACGRLSAVSDSAPLRCTIKDGSLLMEVSNADLGSGREVISLPDWAPQPAFEFLVRLGYLTDALTAPSSDLVSMAYSGALQPMYFTGGEVLTVVMPVRV